MNKDPYQEWLAEKRHVQAPADFADAVMATLAIERPAWKTAAFWAKAAIFTLAAVGGIGRYAIAVFLIFFG
jgi:hypothetical protein